MRNSGQTVSLGISSKAYFSELRLRTFLDAKQVGDHPLGKPGQYTSHPAAGKLSLHRPLRMKDGSVKLLDEVVGGSRSFSGGIDAKRADRTMCLVLQKRAGDY
jgi:hypothetical protein